MSVTFYPMDDFWLILAHFGRFWVIFGSGPLLPKLELWEGMFLRMKRKAHPSPAHTPRVWVSEKSSCRKCPLLLVLWTIFGQKWSKPPKNQSWLGKIHFSARICVLYDKFLMCQNFLFFQKSFLSPLELFLCQNSFFASDTALNRIRGDFAILPIYNTF